MEEDEEVQVPEDKDANIELGSLHGSEEERSDGELNVYQLRAGKYLGFCFLTGFNQLTVRNISDLRRSLIHFLFFPIKNDKLGSRVSVQSNVVE